MGRKEPEQPKRLRGNGCLPFKRSEEPDRPPCMIPPRLGAVDYRVLCFYDRSWVDWDSMQFAFDDLNDEIEAMEVEPGYTRRVVLVHGGDGSKAVKLAETMAQARYGWAVESHRLDWGHSKIRLAVRHMLSLGANLILTFRLDHAETRDLLLTAVGRATRDLTIPERAVKPAHDLEILARKGLNSPPMLGGEEG